jgi:hypothetical protein
MLDDVLLWRWRLKIIDFSSRQLIPAQSWANWRWMSLRSGLRDIHPLHPPNSSSSYTTQLNVLSCKKATFLFSVLYSPLLCLLSCIWLTLYLYVSIIQLWAQIVSQWQLNFFSLACTKKHF